MTKLRINALFVFAVCIAAALNVLGSSQQTRGADARPSAKMPGILGRHCEDGEKLSYHMKGSNQNWQYEIDANGVVKKDADGHFYEEYEWARMTSDHAPYVLPEASQKMRQKLSLNPDLPPSIPNLSQVDVKLIGPISDLLTIYSDLWLANKIGVFS